MRPPATSGRGFWPRVATWWGRWTSSVAPSSSSRAWSPRIASSRASPPLRVTGPRRWPRGRRRWPGSLAMRGRATTSRWRSRRRATSRERRASWPMRGGWTRRCPPFSAERSAPRGHDPYAVVRELVVHAGRFVLGHVAGHAVLPRDRAHASGAVLGRGRRDRGRSRRLHVAAQAARVVGRGLPDQRQVRIMAGHAGDPRIARAPALARLQAIGLRAQGGNALLARELHVPERRVAGAAEVDGGGRIKLGRVQDRVQREPELLLLQGLDVLAAGPVAGLAGDSGDEPLGVEHAGHGRGRVVTGEAAARLRVGNGPRHRLGQVL